MSWTASVLRSGTRTATRTRTRTRTRSGFVAAALISLASASLPLTSSEAHAQAASPIYGVTIPHGYRKWQFVAPAEEADPLNELRIVLGNPIAMKALEKNTLPFPDGSTLVKLAWKRVPSTEFGPASVPGAATTVQVRSRIRSAIATQAAGALAGSSTVSRLTSRNIRPALRAIRRA